MVLAKPRTLAREIAKEAYPTDTTDTIASFLRRYQASAEAVDVCFRDLVPWLKMGERATHHLHPYPGKLLPQIPHFFLAARGWLPRDGIVLDPFAGAGTVILEANLSGRPALYADVNPLGRLITLAKTKPIAVRAAARLLPCIQAAYNQITEAEPPWVVNIVHWYSPTAILNLARLRSAIAACSAQDAREFLLATFSATTRKCSLADPRYSVPVRDRTMLNETAERPERVWQIFEKQFYGNLDRYQDLQLMLPNRMSSRYVGNDARLLLRQVGDGSLPLSRLPKNSVDVIITSPPYAGAQKYIRASSLNLGWLGETASGTLKELESASIGREHLPVASVKDIPETGIASADQFISDIAQTNGVRAAICAYYLTEMNEAIKEMVRVLKPGGKTILVVGDNTVCGRHFPISRYLEQYCSDSGMQLKLRLIDKIKSRSLMMKRAGGAKVIQSENILVFEK